MRGWRILGSIGRIIRVISWGNNFCRIIKDLKKMKKNREIGFFIVGKVIAKQKLNNKKNQRVNTSASYSNHSPRQANDGSPPTASTINKK